MPHSPRASDARCLILRWLWSHVSGNDDTDDSDTDPAIRKSRRQQLACDLALAMARAAISRPPRTKDSYPAVRRPAGPYDLSLLVKQTFCEQNTPVKFGKL